MLNLLLTYAAGSLYGSILVELSKRFEYVWVKALVVFVVPVSTTLFLKPFWALYQPSPEWIILFLFIAWSQAFDKLVRARLTEKSKV